MKIYLYTRFERFWHWVQALLIIILLMTGLEIHGSYVWLGFKKAFQVHNFCAWSLLILYAFIVFWLITTGEWKQYLPTYRKLLEVVRYYLFDIFRGKPHPVPKTESKHNPLQRITYLMIVSFLVPFQIITGFLYYYYNKWTEWNIKLSLDSIAYLHTAGAFAFFIFLIVHIYMTTTGETIFTHIKAMFTGYEEVEKEEEVATWEVRTK